MFSEKNSFFDFEAKNENTLSMSDAQSISNLVNQKAEQITNKYKSVNNYSTYLRLDTLSQAAMVDKGDSTVSKTKAVNMPPIEEVVADFKRKGDLHALQAFLMEHIKLKEHMIKSLKQKRNEAKDYTNEELELRLNIKKPVFVEEPIELVEYNEETINEFFTKEELLRTLISESHAAHIGQFIHKDGKLSALRKELPTISGYTYEKLPDGRSAVVTNVIHADGDALEQLHEILANEHRDYTRSVNGQKAKAKDLLLLENNKAASDWQQKKSQQNIRANSHLTEFGIYTNAIGEERARLKLEHQHAVDEELKTWVKARIIVPSQFRDLILELKPKTK